MSVQIKLNNSWEHLRNSRKAILARGGDISLTAGLKDLSDAIFNISDSSLAQAIDSSTAYRKIVPVGASPYATISKIGGMSYKSNNLYSGEAKMDVVKISGKAVLVAPKDGYYSFNCDSSNVVNPDVLWLESTGGHWIEGWFPFENIYLNKGEEVSFRFNEIPDYDENGNPNYPLSGYVTDIMINEGAKPLPYEPYFKGLRATKVTALKSNGAQLIPFPYRIGGVGTVRTSNGVTLTVLEDSKIQLNGTASSTATFIIMSSYSPVTGTVFLSGCDEGNDDTFGITIHFWSGNEPWQGSLVAGTLAHRHSPLTVNAEDYGCICVYVYVQSGVTVDNVILEPMLNYGTEAAPSKPYKADAVDTLTVPSEIISIEGYGESNPDNPEEYNYIDLLANALVLVGRVIDEEWTRFATPEVIPIKINKYLATEEGGSIVFDNDHEYAVPSEIKYIIKSGV